MTPTVSVIIPSHNDIYLHKTIDSLLNNAGGNIEVIVVLDGYDPALPITDDKRVRVARHGINMGMREAINTGASMARGKYLMRTDEHCMFGPSYDTILASQIEHNWIVVPRRYKLDPVKWVRMDKRGFIDYEKLVILCRGNIQKFASNEWKERRDERLNIPVDETMTMQGSCWFMHRSWWESVIVGLKTEGYGPLYQDTTEMLFKTWNAKGKLMVNKLTWYAHKHRDFNRTHQYPTSRAIPEWKYALDLWRDDYEKVRDKWQI
jgi:glycosyltransferase involved in cell wall biosynthesis